MMLTNSVDLSTSNNVVLENSHEIFTGDHMLDPSQSHQPNQ